METRLRRSCLAVPGTSAPKLLKAMRFPADEVVLDLEDAVARPDKNNATRTQVVDEASVKLADSIVRRSVK